ncbi:MAG TPA: hypothetical protein VLJ80_03085 [Solirubrobacteraceae bacterium]|nr:hypothetical protein [Solirubrobacteraceae bacterium]
MDSQTSATTSAAPAQPNERPGASGPPGAGAAAPSPGPDPARAPEAPPAAASSAAPATEVSPVSPASGDRAAAEPQAPAAEQQTGFGSRGRRRRRARFLRKARELAYRDLGGLVFSLHRFGQRNDSLVLAKLATLSRIDAELRALEDSLGERQPVTVLREAGITACPRCAAIHSGEDRFCPSCGLSMSRRSDLPIAGAPAGGVAQTPAASAPAPAGSPLAGSPPTAQPAPTVTQPAQPPTAGSAAGTGPATQQHAAVPAPGAPGAPHAAPQPATQAFDAIPADGGDQPTEIIRPPAPGS